MTDSIQTPDGTIEVTIDPEETALYATGITVSQTEKVNLGDYENRELYANLRVSLDPALELTDDTEGHVARILEYAHEEVEQHIQAKVDQAQPNERLR